MHLICNACRRHFNTFVFISSLLTSDFSVFGAPSDDTMGPPDAAAATAAATPAANGNRPLLFEPTPFTFRGSLPSAPFLHVLPPQHGFPWGVRRFAAAARTRPIPGSAATLRREPGVQPPPQLCRAAVPNWVPWTTANGTDLPRPAANGAGLSRAAANGADICRPDANGADISRSAAAANESPHRLRWNATGAHGRRVPRAEHGASGIRGGTANDTSANPGD